MAKMKAARVPKPGADFEIVEGDIPSPGPGQALVRVMACGICHSDVLTKEGHYAGVESDGGWPGIQYPRVPGHEIAGIIHELGPGVASWKKGQRVGGGLVGRTM